ncbi:hypothetical protein BGX38DRAFT_1140791 [Terfezia claveryi]|nr:hypothetical protein BGX38DRAFT_1140791 [Terfezia claveryi]
MDVEHTSAKRSCEVWPPESENGVMTGLRQYKIARGWLTLIHHLGLSSIIFSLYIEANLPQEMGYSNKYTYSDSIILTSDVSRKSDTTKELQLTISNLQSQLQRQAPIPNTTPITPTFTTPAPFTITPQTEKLKTKLTPAVASIMAYAIITGIILVKSYIEKKQEEKKLRDRSANKEERRIAKEEELGIAEEKKNKKEEEFPLFRDSLQLLLRAIEVIERETAEGRSWFGGLGRWIWR